MSIAQAFGIATFLIGIFMNDVYLPWFPTRLLVSGDCFRALIYAAPPQSVAVCYGLVSLTVVFPHAPILPILAV
jgi:hypothetical protein